MKTSAQKKQAVQKMGARALAAHIIREVHFQQRSLSVVLPEFREKFQQQIDPGQQALVQEICYGSLRWFIQLDAILKKLLKKPPRTKDNIIYYLLITGLYQLIYLHKPDYVVVKETVADLKALDRLWAKGLVNAILRAFLREQAEKTTLVSKKTAIEHQLDRASAHPHWFIQRLKKDWTQAQVEQILTANNQRPPLWLRHNQSKISAPEYQQLLTKNDQSLAFELLSTQFPAIRLIEPIAVEKIPGFKQGLVSVQDAAAQCAASILDVQKGDKVLDACAAPGGKTSHLLEKYPELSSLLAIDISTKRLSQIQENFQRLGLNAAMLEADASDIDKWWDGDFFDRILLDAPCSATGVIRRHPDIKILRKDSDIEKLCQTQANILAAMWSILKPGGQLLYATCSVLRDENDRQVTQFLQQHKNAQQQPIKLAWGRAMSVGWQIFPGEAQLDGFYYALIKKTKAE